MTEFELNSHAEYAKKSLSHEVSFFEAMVIPPWASSFFGATNHSNEDILNIILAYKKHNVFLKIIKKTDPIIDILLYYRLLVYKKLLLSLSPTKESNETLQKLCLLLTELAMRHSYFFTDNLLAEKEMRRLLNLLRATRQLKERLKDPYLKFTRLKKYLKTFYDTVIHEIIDDDPNDLLIVACYINPFFQAPGGKNKKILMAAHEVFNYEKQANDWIKEYSQVALVAIDRGKPDMFDPHRIAAIYESGLHFDDVALAIITNPKIAAFYSHDELSELGSHLIESENEGVLAPTKPSEPRPIHFQLTQADERAAIKKSAARLYAYFYRLSQGIIFFRRRTLITTSNHLFDILTIINNNDKEILPIIADYWHKTYRLFRISSHSTQFRHEFQPYLTIIINFFNDKDISEKDDQMLKLFLQYFLDLCEQSKEKMTTKTPKIFRTIIDRFLSIRS